MKFTLEIDCSNAAFHGADAEDDYALAREEVARILTVAAGKVMDPTSVGALLDGNGNRVGTFWFDSEFPEAAPTGVDEDEFDEDEERFGEQDPELVFLHLPVAGPPTAHRVRRSQFPTRAYALIGCRTVACVEGQVGPATVDVWVDDEGLLHDVVVLNRRASKAAGVNLAGGALLTGEADDEGEVTSVPTSVLAFYGVETVTQNEVRA